MTRDIRTLQKSDLEGLLSLYRHLHPVDDPLPPPKKVEDIWRDILADPHQLYLGVFTDNRLVAVCNGSIILNLTRGARPFAVIDNVVVHSDFQRRGIGRALMERMVDECRSHQCYKIMLMSSRKRSDAHAFYRSIGFDPDVKQAFVITTE